LLEKRNPFKVDPPGCLEDQGTEDEVRAYKPNVVLGVFLSPCIRVGRRLRAKTSRAKRTGDRNVHSQTLPIEPGGKCDVTWTTTRRRTQYPLLLQDWRQEAFLTKPLEEVPYPIVSDDGVPILSAACGVITVTI
jgi:hypothetical protein